MRELANALIVKQGLHYRFNVHFIPYWLVAGYYYLIQIFKLRHVLLDHFFKLRDIVVDVPVLVL